MRLDSPGTAPTAGSVAATGSVDAVQVLAMPRRVAVLAALSAAETPMSDDELARRVAAREGGKSPDDVTASERRTVRLSLRHYHLPALSTHGLIEWRSSDDEVDLGPDLSAERVLGLLGDRSLTAASRLFETFAQPRRRLVLAILREHDEPLSVDELARLVAAEERASAPDTVPETDVSRIRVSLHHSHLPVLSAMDALEYDPEVRVVR